MGGTDMRNYELSLFELHLVTQLSETPDWAPCSSWLVNQVKRDYMRFHNNLRWKKLKNNLELKTNNQELTDEEVRSSWPIGEIWESEKFQQASFRPASFCGLFELTLGKALRREPWQKYSFGIEYIWYWYHLVWNTAMMIWKTKWRLIMDRRT